MQNLARQTARRLIAIANRIDDPTLLVEARHLMALADQLEKVEASRL